MWLKIKKLGDNIFVKNLKTDRNRIPAQIFREQDSYLLCDCAGTFNELSFGEAVRGSDLQSSGLLDEENAAMSKLLNTSLDLETDLGDREQSQRAINLMQKEGFESNCLISLDQNKNVYMHATFKR